MSPKLRLMSLLVLLGVLSTVAPSSFAQNGPLNFSNNFFVTGDYIVAGAYGINTNFTIINGASYTTGVISVPDPNPGITGANQVPKGAQIVAALLYWQTIEKAGVAGGATGSGQNGYIRPLLYSKTGGPAAPGYAFSGTNVSPSSNVPWSLGGCSGTSTGKVLQTYRADVAGSLPLDANGNPTANGSFEVRLPSAVLLPPFTLGATLVVIYRILSGAGGPTIPLNAIVLYDGDYAPTKPQLTTTQQLQGFYDAAHNPVSRLTHIVGNGNLLSYETVYLNGKALPSLYGRLLPSFPGYYGVWDNPTWTFTSSSQNPANPVTEDSSSANTQVVPLSAFQGCFSWGAVIVSTTVKNSDNDGILDSWKKTNPPGYCDAALNNGVCSVGNSQDPGWVPLPGATPGEQDVFLQYDYMCSSISSGSCSTMNGNYSFDPRLAIDTQDGLNPHADAVDKVVAAYKAHNIVLHAIPGNAIEESQTPNISCLSSDNTCPFPNQPGTVGFRDGLAYIKNQTVDAQGGVLGCTPPGTSTDPCVPVFQHGKKDSYHYALYSHGVGLPNWFLSDGSIVSVQQSGNTVTFTTKMPHGISQILAQPTGAVANDNLCTNGRVTVVFAVTNTNLNGTFCVLSNPAPTATAFSITVGGSPTNFTYTSKTDPNLGVANGQVTSMSGYSDVGGQNSVISLGYGGWGPPSNPASDGNKWQMKAGTLMHEFGHTMGLTHGGAFLNNLSNNPTDYTPTFEANCKPNVQSSMSYLFQFDLLEVPNELNAAGQPLRVVDYSEDPPSQSPELIPTLTKSSPEGPGILNNLSYGITAAFELTSYEGGTPTSPHCNGTPLLPTDQPMTYVQFTPPSSFFWSSATGEDINFDGNTTDVLHPHNEWEGTSAENGAGPSPGLNLQQVSAVGTISAIGPGGEPGGLKPGGGGGGLQPAGGGGGLKPAGGGGGLKPAGGGGLSAEITHQDANSYARPPQNLSIVQEEASPRFIDLSWFAPTFGNVVNYNIYQSIAGGPFYLLASVPGSQTTYQATVTCNPAGYSYRVTAVTLNDSGQPQESVPSNTVPAAGQPLLTGCYVVSNYSSPASVVQGSPVPITWTLTDDFYATPAAGWANAASGNPVTNLAANTLLAIGPIAPTSTDGPCPATAPANATVTTLLSKGTVQSGGSTFGVSAGQFTFNWNTVPFSAGCYFFQLNLDSSQSETTTYPLQVLIYVSDTGPYITTTTLPNAVVGTAYSNSIDQAGGIGAVTWSIISGMLPAGITLNASTGVLSGYATTAGTYPFTAEATDSEGNYGTRALSLTVLIFVSDSPPPAAPPFTASTTLPDAIVGVAYNNTVYESGGVNNEMTPFTWTIVANSVMPGNGSTLPGLSFQANVPPATNGILSGTPTTTGTYTFTAQVMDSKGDTGMQTFTLTVRTCEPAPSGLVSWYPFNGNALDIRGGKPGTLVGSGGTFVPAEINQGFKGNGTSIVSVPNSPTLALNAFSIGAWVRVDNIDSVPTMQIVWKGDNTAADLTTPYSLSVLGSAAQTFSAGATVIGSTAPGEVLVIITNGSQELDVLSSSALTTGTFHYVAVTADGTNVNLYIDGQLDPNTPTAEVVQPFASPNPLQIGGLQNDSLTFDGVINELQIWGTALTQTQIASIYNAAEVGECQNLWFTENSVSKVGKITPEAPNTSTDFATTTPASSPMGIAAGPDGNVWFTEFTPNNIGVITPAGSPLTEYAVNNTNAAGAYGIATGSDGNLWFTEAQSPEDASYVGRITPAGTIAVYQVAFSAALHGITAGPDGNLWFTENANNEIGTITPAGSYNQFPIPSPLSSVGVTSGAAGTGYSVNDVVTVVQAGASGGTLTVTSVDGSGAVTGLNLTTAGTGYTVAMGVSTTTGGNGSGLEVDISATVNSGPEAISVGPDGNLWFTESLANQIGVITPAGTFGSQFTVPTPGSTPMGIALGPDGNLWFAESSTDKIGNVTVRGVFTEYSVPGSPQFITNGPDGNLWFTENAASQIGRITPSGVVTEFPAPTANSGPWGITEGP